MSGVAWADVQGNVGWSVSYITTMRNVSSGRNLDIAKQKRLTTVSLLKLFLPRNRLNVCSSVRYFWGISDSYKLREAERKALNSIQSTLVISKSKGPSETLRDIRTSTYQMCSIEENTNGTTKFHKWTCNLTPLVRNICWKYCAKGRNCSSWVISPLIHNILLPDVRFVC